MNRIRGIDSIRFVCAAWVMLSHVGLPPIFGKPEHGILHLFDRFYTGIINGPAAVVVFFVISGFCIHYPYRNGQKPYLPSFYTRRLLRIGLPLIGGITVYLLAGASSSLKDFGILWSLVAEIIYYLLYPGLLVLASRIGWQRLVVIAFIAACGVAATNPTAGNYPSYGHGLNWLLGLPVWLLGCLLAQRSDHLPQTVSPAKIWLWRGAVIAGSSLVTIVRWHIPHISIGNPWSLNVFAFLAFAWLAQEVAYFRQNEPSRWLEWAGAWSYSLYLMHIPCPAAVDRFLPNSGLSPFLQNLIHMSAALVGAYAFFIIVERPSHLFSVWVSAKFKKFSPSSSPVTVAVKQT